MEKQTATIKAIIEFENLYDMLAELRGIYK